jgi:hypothetical protein
MMKKTMKKSEIEAKMKLNKRSDLRRHVPLHGPWMVGGMLRYRLVTGLVSGRSGRRIGQARFDGWSVDSRWGICRQSQNEGCRQSAYFAGVLFAVSGHFRPVSVNFVDFRALIFPF